MRMQNLKKNNNNEFLKTKLHYTLKLQIFEITTTWNMGVPKVKGEVGA